MYIKPVEAYCHPNVLIVSLIFIFLLIFPPIFAVGFTLSFFEEHNIPVRTEIVAIVIIFYTLILIFLVLPFLMSIFSKGRIKVDSRCIEWNISGNKGKILWEKPFTINRSHSVYEYTMAVEIPYKQQIPVIIYEISQENENLTFYRGASYDEVKNLPFINLCGYMVVYRARALTKTIDRIEKYLKQNHYGNLNTPGMHSK